MTIKLPEITVVLTPADFVAFSDMVTRSLDSLDAEIAAEPDPERGAELTADAERIKRTSARIIDATNEQLTDETFDDLSDEQISDKLETEINLGGNYPPALIFGVALDGLIESAVVFDLAAQIAGQMGMGSAGMLFGAGHAAADLALEIWASEPEIDPELIDGYNRRLYTIQQRILRQIRELGAEIVDPADVDIRRQTTRLLNNPAAFRGPKL